MRWIFLYLLALVSLSVQAAGTDTTRIQTRYGTLNTAKNADTVDIRFRNKVVRSIDALDASLYRVTPKDQREFIVVDALTPGLNCHHVFVLVEVLANGNATASEPFGECKELQGVEFHGESPVVRLGEPDISGQRKSSVSSGFEWRNGNMVELSGTAAAKPANACAATGIPKDSSYQGTSGERIYRVAGTGRLQFLSAPSPGCDQVGVFVVPGDKVHGYRHAEPYIFVQYVNPKSGKSVQGWVLSSRLVDAGAPWKRERN
jgi:hypothetical protein